MRMGPSVLLILIATTTTPAWATHTTGLRMLVPMGVGGDRHAEPQVDLTLGILDSHRALQLDFERQSYDGRWREYVPHTGAFASRSPRGFGVGTSTLPAYGANPTARTDSLAHWRAPAAIEGSHFSERQSVASLLTPRLTPLNSNETPMIDSVVPPSGCADVSNPSTVATLCHDFLTPCTAADNLDLHGMLERKIRNEILCTKGSNCTSTLCTVTYTSSPETFGTFGLQPNGRYTCCIGRVKMTRTSSCPCAVLQQ